MIKSKDYNDLLVAESSKQRIEIEQWIDDLIRENSKKGVEYKNILINARIPRKFGFDNIQYVVEKFNKLGGWNISCEDHLVYDETNHYLLIEAGSQ